jgi:hypothetical protein
MGGGLLRVSPISLFLDLFYRKKWWATRGSGLTLADRPGSAADFGLPAPGQRN